MNLTPIRNQAPTMRLLWREKSGAPEPLRLGLYVAVMASCALAWTGCGRAASEEKPKALRSSFALSARTKEVVAGLAAPVEVRYYVSPALLREQPATSDYAEVVADVLELYRQAGRGRISIKRISPQVDTDSEDSAKLDGIEPMTTTAGKARYFGLCLGSGAEKRTIPYLSPLRERLLEYDISRALSRLGSTRKSVVGVLSTSPVLGDPGTSSNKAWVAFSELQKDYEVKQIAADGDAIPSGVDVLLVHRPRQLKPAMAYAIDRYIGGGGRAILLLDALSLRTTLAEKAAAATGESGLEPILKAWGISFSSKKVVADGMFGTSIGQKNGPPTRAPGILALEKNGMNANDTVTFGLDQMLLAYAGVFEGKPVANLRQTVLLHTSEEAELVDPFMAEIAGEQVLRDLKPSKVEYVVAMRLEGRFPSAYPGGAPGVAKGDESAGNAKQVARDSAVVVVGDADFVMDALCVRQLKVGQETILQPMNGNLSFLQNSVEQLDGGVVIPAMPDLVAEKRRLRFLARPAIKLPPASAMDEYTRSVTNLIRMTPEEGTAVLQRESQSEYQALIKDLEVKVAESQKRLSELQSNKPAGERSSLSAEQSKVLEEFKKSEAETKEKLKHVRRTLRARIEALEHLHGITNNAAEE